MTRRVHRHADFEADFLRLLESLVTRGEESWVVALYEGVAEASRMLAKLPGAGVRMAERGTVIMRKLILPKGPYVAWYLYDAADARGAVWLVRLFHSRQRRPLPRPGRWLEVGRRKR